MSGKSKKKEVDGGFEREWKWLAKRGHCDGWGSKECNRVWQKWLGEGCPANVYGFILLHANDCGPHVVE